MHPINQNVKRLKRFQIPPQSRNNEALPSTHSKTTKWLPKRKKKMQKCNKINFTQKKVHITRKKKGANPIKLLSRNRIATKNRNRRSWLFDVQSVWFD